MKKFTIILCLFIFLSSCQSKNTVDLSDINNMQITHDMPELIYFDETEAIIVGEFGIAVFDVSRRSITHRLSWNELSNIFYKGGKPDIRASCDGTEIYIGIANPNSLSISEFDYTYKIKLSKIVKQKTNVLDPKVFNPSYFNGDNLLEYSLYFNDNYSKSYSYIEKDNYFVYLRVTKDWKMKNLQLVICPLNNGESEIIDIFQ